MNNAQNPVERSINSTGLADKLSWQPNQINRANGIKQSIKTNVLIQSICFLLGIFDKEVNMSGWF
jgi:hypothetical protein